MAGALLPIIAHSWTLATGLSLLAWYVFAPQCLSTLAVVRRETNSWRYPLYMAAYLFALAYLGAFVTYRVALLLGAGVIALSAGVQAVIVALAVVSCAALQHLATAVGTRCGCACWTAAPRCPASGTRPGIRRCARARVAKLRGRLQGCGSCGA